MKDEFLKIYGENIHREGSEKLLAWLEKSDFFTAPASTKYHSAHEGGLCKHSVNVYLRLRELVPEESVRESIAVCALLHDLCKVNLYKVEQRNTKDDQGKWIQVPYYTIDDQLPYGHGEKSVYMISGFMRLSREESMAIRWHMGQSDGDYGAAAQAFSKYPLALFLHIADLEATFIDEKEIN